MTKKTFECKERCGCHAEVVEVCKQTGVYDKFECAVRHSELVADGFVYLCQSERSMFIQSEVLANKTGRSILEALEIVKAQSNGDIVIMK